MYGVSKLEILSKIAGNKWYIVKNEDLIDKNKNFYSVLNSN